MGKWCVKVLMCEHVDVVIGEVGASEKESWTNLESSKQKGRQ